MLIINGMLTMPRRRADEGRKAKTSIELSVPTGPSHRVAGEPWGTAVAFQRLDGVRNTLAVNS